MRSRVRIHDDYHDVQNYGPETTDIIYDDIDGNFTNLLIENGYLSRDIWTDQRPYYYIEVKATINELQTPFFVSHYQYNLIHEHELSNDSPSRKVVLIARVFNLGAASMGFKLFLDPATLRKRKELKFMERSYEVFQL